MKGPLQPQQMLRLLFWETTTRCNLACAHCRRLESAEVADAPKPLWRRRAAIEDLSTARAIDLIRQLAELGKEQSLMPVLVFSGGEPLCRQDLFELIGQARSLGIIPALATNGTLIDPAAAKTIRDSGIVRVAISLDGATAEVHDKMRQAEGAFQSALEGIRHLHEEKVPLQINVTLTKHNAEQLEDIYELARSLGAVAVHIFMLVPVGCGQVLAETDMLSPQQYEQKLLEICRLDSRGQIQLKVTCGPHYERIIRQQAKNNKYRITNVEQRDSKFEIRHSKFDRGCLAGLGVLFVAHQGDVFPCGYLPIRCGNVLEEPLSQIWYNNKDLARMRDSSALEGKCGLCGYREVCGGCRARAYAVTGNYMAEEPFCAYIPPEVVR